ncbi:Glyoxalase-like domain-containing protein [Cribrihabitans marinus]|uniref:Glyoxalase-like domain-containing protein n=1 Tax=Cribrihabitans marinus TaxID=1227549 RepID=A0A1H6ZJC7_9RHOB|nr:VOC family protein [Cribrihabitans marinus]GGH30547.1 polyphosphate kinase [Cribrihabitans marinus]SEJ53388.1 Glyoxalase-like domain-containing protein [Cribrihabitans marinus]
MQLDHLAVAGESLGAAAEAVETALGVPMQSGGRHARFGTHNRLLGLAGGLYLEAIAVDPDAPDPGRARWFDMDRFSGPPRLGNWICRTGDLDAALAALPVAAGKPVALERGDLQWRMAVPDDGVLPFDNLFPALIQWQGDLHPASMLTDRGCALRRLVVSHPDAAALAEVLAPIPLVVIEPGEPGLMAEFDTPHGLRVLR